MYTCTGHFIIIILCLNGTAHKPEPTSYPLLIATNMYMVFPPMYVLKYIDILHTVELSTCSCCLQSNTHNTQLYVYTSK